MPDYKKRVMLLCLAFCMVLTCCGCYGKQEQPGPTGPTFRIPEMPSVQQLPEETHPLKEEYKKQPNAYVAFTQTHQSPREVYVPVEEIMTYQTQYPDCNGTWFRDQLQGEDLCIYNCYLYALEHCYLSFSLYVEDNDRSFDYIREAVSMDTPFMEQNVNQRSEWIHDWPTDYWGEQLFVTLEQFAVNRWEKRMEALEKCRQIVAEIPAEYVTQTEKMEYLFRYVCDHVEYVAYENMRDEDFLYDAVINGQTVCDGYSNMLMLLFRLIGVECCEAAGYDVDITLDEDYEDAGGHTWVVAKVDGNWYNFDATFEDTRKDDLQWENLFFGFSDRRLSKKFMVCENIRPQCADLSRDFPVAELTLTDATDTSQVKQLVRLVEKRIKAGKAQILVGLSDAFPEETYNAMMKKYKKYVTQAHRLEISTASLGGSTLIFLTAEPE